MNSLHQTPKRELWGKWRIAWLTDHNVQEVNELLKTSEIDGIGVSPYSGFSLKNIHLLERLEPIQGLVIPYPEGMDLSVLNDFSTLQFLCLGELRQPLDFRLFHQLRDLRIYWNKEDHLPDGSLVMETFSVHNYKSKKANLVDLPVFERLNTLHLVKANCESLFGIEKFGALSKLELGYCSKLASLANLEGVTLEQIEIEGCKKIVDFSKLRSCPRLSKIVIDGCGSIPSLDFLSECSSLREFRFVNTEIQDGNMMPLVNLERVGFIAKRKYSHTPEEITSLISYRQMNSNKSHEGT